ncbi:MAG TPA: response regulator transcription factor [Euzebyales bacterium]|nr:response regulator transcription factor [Euzebyales bacterium]
MAPAVTRIMVVDDHPLVRQGLRFLLEPERDIVVAAEADTVALAIDQSRALTPHVVVMDARLPDGSGVEACRAIRSEHPEISLLMLTSAPDDEALYLSVIAGADGFVPKQVRGRRIVSAIRQLVAGEPLHDPREIARALDRMRVRAGTRAVASHLTPIERSVTELIARGATNREIVTRLEIDEAVLNDQLTALVSDHVGGRRAEVADILLRHLAPAQVAPAP